MKHQSNQQTFLKGHCRLPPKLVACLRNVHQITQIVVGPITDKCILYHTCGSSQLAVHLCLNCVRQIQHCKTEYKAFVSVS